MGVYPLNLYFNVIFPGPVERDLRIMVTTLPLYETAGVCRDPLVAVLVKLVCDELPDLLPQNAYLVLMFPVLLRCVGDVTVITTGTYLGIYTIQFFNAELAAFY